MSSHPARRVKKSKSKATENKNEKTHNYSSKHIDSDCGFETVSENGAKKRRSKRLRDVRTRKEEDDDNTSTETESESDSDHNPPKSNKKRKRKATDDEKSPPKKKPKKTLSKKANSQNVVKNPSFTRKGDSLKRIGIAYTKSSPKRSTKTAKLHYKSQRKYQDKLYKWHGNGKYKLAEILGHKLERDMEVVLADCEEDRMWYASINYAPIQAMMEEDANELGEDLKEKESDMEAEEAAHDEDDDVSVQSVQMVGVGSGDGAERPQLCFGKLLFECKWEDWGESSWECWDRISGTKVFGQYVEAKGGEGLVAGNELLSTIHLHGEEELHGLVMNIALFGNPTTRKALKMMVSKELSVW